ncbi:sel1 repeat family protein [Inquilinus limosus]|uniref:Sel1 repeat family protein n=1 Tax=Inquilinus limosus TaxID=171674 RepID=A0A211YSF3_9PROT|nr:sel1 repeat family protein [Inquilinus limosus]OWJ55886.1 hypothetical protein BWR60_35720 [Inquilinus limosus]
MSAPERVAPSDFKALRRAAEAGDAAAQFNLGVLSDSRIDDNGYAVPGDRAEALRWLEQAAAGGLPRAQLRLATLYADSRPASGDRVRAGAWFLVAAARLTGAQRAAAEAGYRALAAGLSAGRRAKACGLAARLAALPPADPP